MVDSKKSEKKHLFLRLTVKPIDTLFNVLVFVKKIMPKSNVEETQPKKLYFSAFKRSVLRDPSPI